jgi:hypothetical protein
LGFRIRAFFDSIPASIRRGEIEVAEPRDYRQADLFRPALEAIIDMGHPLVRLAGKIDWGFLARRFGEVYAAGDGQPPWQCQTKCARMPKVVVASCHEQPVPIFQQFAGGYPSSCDDVREIPVVTAQR